MKLNLGCGNDYREGWTNLDFNRGVKADVYADLCTELPFGDGSFSEILLDNVLEHVKRDNYFSFLDELHRICVPNAVIRIYVPHFSSMFALKHPAHHNFFGIGSFSLFGADTIFTGERYCEARFSTECERLLFFHHNLVNYKLLSVLPINGLFNFCGPWQLMMERFQFFGFDEIYFELKAIK